MKETTKKGLIILFGESFRGDIQNNFEQTILNQLISTNSHLFLFKNIEKKFNLKLDKFLLSRLVSDPLHEELFLILKELYNFKEFNFCKNPRDLGVTNFLRWLENEILKIFNSENIYQYEFVFLMRIDAAMDQFFLNYFNPCDNKVRYMFPLPYLSFPQNPKKPKINAGGLFYKHLQQDIDFLEKGGITILNKKDISNADCHIFWPKNLFDKIKQIHPWDPEKKEMQIITHHGGHLKTEKYIGEQHVDCYINSLHNVRTGVSWNPFFWFPTKPISFFRVNLQLRKESKFMFLEKIDTVLEKNKYPFEDINRKRINLSEKTKNSSLLKDTIKRLKAIL